MTQKSIIVRSGLSYKRRTQSAVGGGHVPRYAGKVAEIGGRKTAFRYVRRGYGLEYVCWCTNWFVVGKIIRVIGDYGDRGNYGAETYPDYCKSPDSNIKNYIGIRYEVSLCQGRNKKTYICLPSDFAEYAIDDKVIIFMRGTWNEIGNSIVEPTNRVAGEACEKVSCVACKGNRREDQTGDEADGTFLIMPLEIDGVNKQ